MTETATPVVPHVRVELVENGVWLPDFGLSVNAIRGAAPAIIARVDVLRAHGRKKGILAAEHTWNAAFPNARSPKAPAPLNRDVRLGLTRLTWYARPEESGNAHIRIVGEQLNCVLIEPEVRIDYESIFGTMPDQPLTIIVGPIAEQGKEPLATLSELAANWPNAAFVLYGSEVHALSEHPFMPVLKQVEMLTPPQQDSLF